MSDLRRVVLDVLKPHEPELLEFTDRIAELESVEAATIDLLEHDREVQNVRLSVEGRDVEYSAVEGAVEELGGTVHSVDQVAAGEHVADGWRAPEDA